MFEKRFFAFIAALALLMLASAGCAVRTHKGNLHRMDDVVRSQASDSSADAAQLTRRVDLLYKTLESDKITTAMTKQKIAGFFKDERDLVNFLAIYASLFRKMDFYRDRVVSYKIRDVVIEENGVVGLVRLDVKGWIYVALMAKISEIQEWQKIEGEWYLIPKAS